MIGEEDHRGLVNYAKGFEGGALDGLKIRADIICHVLDNHGDFMKN